MTTKTTYSFFIGIDPGLTGAIAILDQSGNLMHVSDIPTITQGGFIKRRVDPGKLTSILSDYLNPTSDRISPANRHASDSKNTDIDLNPSNRVLAAIEVVGHRHGQGALSGASLASSMAYCEGVLAGLGIDTLRLPPTIWKRAMGLIGAGKEGSVARARALFNVSLRHDQAEACLLARFAWLNREKPLPAIIDGVEEKQHDKKETLAAQEKRTRAKGRNSGKSVGKSVGKSGDDDLGAFAL